MTADVTGAAREQGEEVAGTAQAEAEAVGTAAATAAQDVAETAAAQAGAVAGEGLRNVRDLLGDLRDEMNLQASTQTMRAGELAYTLADDLDAMAEGSQQQGVIADVTRQVAERARVVGEFLQSRDPDQLLEEVRLLARRRPGAFLLGAAAAGIVAGRLGRGAAAARAERSEDRAVRAPRAPRPAQVAPVVPVAPVTVTPGVVVAPPTAVPTAGEGDVLGQEVPDDVAVTVRDLDVAPADAPTVTIDPLETAPAARPARDLTGTARRAAADARRSAEGRRVRR